MNRQVNKHWHNERDSEGFVWLHFDLADSSTNLLSHAALIELEAQLRALGHSEPAGLIILSDKRNGFIAGADVTEFTRLATRDETRDQIQRVHSIFNRLETLGCPTLALIKGFCLGGGLELAMACRYRIACDDPGTRLGLPEVRLGLFPGYGGTLRSTRLLGSLPALNLMLTGKTVTARVAQRMGLVDMAVPERQMLAGARRLLRDLPRAQRPGWVQRLPANPLTRPAVGWYLRRQLKQKIDSAHYPAPLALIDHWQRFAGKPLEMGRHEADKVSELMFGETARNLIRVFMLQERLKSIAKANRFDPRHIHVVGGGVMGGDIAAWCALRGLRVTLQDRTPASLSQAIERAHKLFKSRLKHPLEIRAAADRLIPDHRGDGVTKADLVIEAIFEDIEAKQSLFQQLEPRLRPQALLATNTSSIPLEVLGESLAEPGRLIGLHFFNPVAKMQLLEIVVGEQTEALAVEKGAAFARRIDRLPLPVKSSPGFLVNRVLMPYLIESIKLLDEDIPAAIIDRAAVDFGMPMGPVELADRVGLDICLSVAEQLSRHFPISIPERLKRMVEQRKLGRKSALGFYRYRNGKPLRKLPGKGYKVPEDVPERLIFRLLNEAVACLREAVVEDADLLDAGIVFGTGFAPFRGGPMHYIEAAGHERMRSRLKALERQYGQTFRADDGWIRFGKC